MRRILTSLVRPSLSTTQSSFSARHLTSEKDTKELGRCFLPIRNGSRIPIAMLLILAPIFNCHGCSWPSPSSLENACWLSVIYCLRMLKQHLKKIKIKWEIGFVQIPSLLVRVNGELEQFPEVEKCATSSQPVSQLQDSSHNLLDKMELARKGPYRAVIRVAKRKPQRDKRKKKKHTHTQQRWLKSHGS